MSEQGKFPFMYRGAAPSDLNTIANDGYYRLGDLYTNGPSSYLYGILIYFKDSYSYGSQIIFTTDGNQAWRRAVVFSNGIFQDWVQL